MTYTVIAYVTSLIIQLMVGISQGSQPLVSFQYGRGDRAACRKLLRYALTTVCIAAPVLFLVLYVFAPQLVRLYLSHAGEELVAYSVRAFRHYSVSYLFLGFNIVIGGFLTAIESPVQAISISVGRGLALQRAVLLTLAAAVGGEPLNAGLPAAGLLDEGSILSGAGIDGRGGMQSVFDGLPMERGVTPLKLTSVQQYGSGAVWLRYNVEK